MPRLVARRAAVLALALGLGTAVGCSGGGSPPPAASSAATTPAGATSQAGGGQTALVHWTQYRSIRAVLDLTQPRQDGRLTVAAAGRLFLLGGTGEPEAFAQSDGGYATATGLEPYIALATGKPVSDAGCPFTQDTVYALDPGKRKGVVAISPEGRASRVVDLPGATPVGVVFDDVGRFGYRLLVVAAIKGGSAVYAVDCASRVTTVAAHAPTAEGGIVVAPPSFGSFGGDLIMPDERSGQIWAISPDGKATLVARSGLPGGGDVGVESAGFVPTGFTSEWAAYLADRRSPGNPHPGTDSILRLAGSDLAAAGVAPGDLIVASEGGAKTIAIRCAATCTVRHIADGPATTHAEGHIVFVRSLP